MAERTARSLTLVRHMRWKLHIVGHHDAAQSRFLAGSWRTSTAEDRAHALSCLAWDARERPLPHSTPGPARTLAGRLRRAAREHRDGETLFTADPDGSADPLTQMRAAVLLAHAALRDDCWDSTEVPGTGVREK
ncbi:hypothetical protein ACH4LN_30345 [Streptomyces albus]|uniref:hypothetical protein n=1 Tax=Streptomyces albus TaxID=1888 RepID=UPI00378A8394